MNIQPLKSSIENIELSFLFDFFILFFFFDYSYKFTYNISKDYLKNLFNKFELREIKSGVK